MNAYELAYKLNNALGVDYEMLEQSSIMLRQQADRIAELEKQCAKYEELIASWNTPQTKPLSDEEIYSLLDKCIEYTDDHDHAEFMYKKFARVIEAKVRG